MHSHAWMGKALAQKAIHRLGLLGLYHRAQERGGRLKGFHPSARIEYAAKLAADTRDFCDVNGATMLEIGTGWVPVVPLALHLMGAKRVVTYDLNRHLNSELTLRIVPLLADCFPDIERRTGMDTRPMAARLEGLRSARTVDELFAQANIEYHAPADASKTGLPAGSVDIAYSNLVLEHVTPAALVEIQTEIGRILKPGGVCWHNIDFSDHYAATNRRLSPLNFLCYSERTWERVGQNEILYQNRLRRSHYERLFQRTSFNVLNRVDHRSEQAADALAAGLRLHADFAQIPHAELEIVASRFVLRHEISGA